MGDTIIQDKHEGYVTYMHGIIRDLSTQKPIPNVTFDIWQASSNGKYDFQDPDNQTDNNLRGKFKTDENGEYRLYCLRPTAYSLPTDGPSYQLLQAIDRHPMRPAHIHLMVSFIVNHGFRSLMLTSGRSRMRTTSQSSHKSIPKTTHGSRPTLCSP